jgi:uncharacterized coiled-coil DUF342 family protein
MEQAMQRKAVDLDSLAREISLTTQSLRPVDFAQPHVRISPLPDYVKHADNVDEIGALSAEAVVRQYEAAAKEIEAMGDELKRVAKRCEEIIADCHKTMEEAKVTASAYREEAKRAFDEIEEKTILVKEVSDTCSSLKNRIAHHPAVPA